LKRALVAITLAVGLCAAGRAEADETAQARRAAAARERGRPYTMAELSAGFLALPAAQVCLTSLTNCSRGEFSLALGIHNLYRYRAFGFGAGIEWATTLRNDSARGAESLARDHSRRYFLVEGQVRYYFVERAATEWWAGATLGGVVVNDSWSVKADREPYADTELVGPRAATVGTEGITAGVAAGFEWTFAKNWSWGMKLRYSSWFLPETRKVSPTLDVASLSGRVDMFDFGAAIAYRIAL
jgi:hypothetical protein